MSQTPTFIHLNAHSAFSLLEGVPSVKALAKKAASYGMPAVGVTDTNNMFGAVEMSKYVPEQGVQPILGVQLGLTLQTAEVQQGDRPEAGFITLLVQNETGWRNVLKLVSEAYLKTPDDADIKQVSFNKLTEHAEGLILLTGSAREGAFGKLITGGRSRDACALMKELASVFEGRLYVELQRHGMAEEQQVEPHLLDLADSLNLPLVATNDCRFLERKQSDAFDVMLAIGDGLTMSNPNRRTFTAEHYFKSPEEMAELFKDIPEALANTVEIAKRCAFVVPTGINYMPQWRVEDDSISVEDILRKDAVDGLEDRLETFVYKPAMTDEEKAAKRAEYFDRLEFELKTIEKMGYAGYFLITADFINWAKRNDIPVGPGRGSGAGSLVAWSIRITDVDPVVWGLYFERFLNPERVSLPDFDIDFCQDRRDEVIQYVRKKYGDDAVTQILALGSLKARACIRDVGRVLEMPFPQVGQLVAFIPEGPAAIPIAKALEEDERLKALYDDDEDLRQLLDIALQLEGAYRHASMHAAGIHISDRPISDLAPLYKDPRSDMSVTAFSWGDAEYAGLVKFDFLGLKTLTVIKYCLNFLKERGVEFDINLIPLDDVKTFELLMAGHTIGVFQVESQGMTDYLKRIVPDKFQFLSDVVALYRPGPIASGMLDDFIDCRHGRKEPNYPHPILEPVLKETFGVPVYQEQIMRMAQALAGYTLGGADMLRRAMGKKKPSEMAKQRDIFVSGAAKHHNVPAEKANEIFDLMAGFAEYGFNKAHTVAYALISYQTAYLKANYPLEFMAASMTLDRGNSDKVLKFKRELERMQVPLLPPDINKSCRFFRVEGNGIRFALAALKGAGEEAVRFTEDERAQNGEYKDIFDFMARQTPQHMNRRQLEVLIKAGAFDSMEPNRAYLFDNVSTLLAYMQEENEAKNSNQIGLFGLDDSNGGGLPKPTLKPASQWDLFAKLDKEQQAIGFYLSSHPLTAYTDALRTVQGLKDMASLYDLAAEGYTSATVAAILHDKREMKTKSGKRMGFITVSDTSGQEEIALFPETYLNCMDLLEKKRPMLLTVKMNIDGERLRLNVEQAQDLENCLKQQSGLRLRVNDVESVSKLKAIFADAERGDTKCDLIHPVHGLGDVVIRLPKPLHVTRKMHLQIQAVSGVVAV